MRVRLSGVLEVEVRGRGGTEGCGMGEDGGNIPAGMLSSDNKLDIPGAWKKSGRGSVREAGGDELRPPTSCNPSAIC